MYDFTGKNVCYVADCGGIALETCKVLMTKNIAVSTITINSSQERERERENIKLQRESERDKKIFIVSMQIIYCDSK